MTDYTRLANDAKARLEGIPESPWVQGPYYRSDVYGPGAGEVARGAPWNTTRGNAIASFIAAARSDVPALADALLACQRERDELAAEKAKLDGQLFAIAHEIGETLPLDVQHRGAVDALRWLKAKRENAEAERDRLAAEVAAYEKLPGHVYPLEGGGTVIGMTVYDDEKGE